MKITSVKTTLLKRECPVMSDVLSVCTVRQALLVKIETDTELYGIGEAFCYGSPLHVGRSIVEEQLALMLIGQDPEQIENLWQTMYWRTIANGRRGVVMAAVSGIDIALWDLLGKMLKAPISTLLGRHQDRVPAYASGGFYAPGKSLDGPERELEGYVKKGYSVIKIKIGRNPHMPHNAIRHTADQSFGVSYGEDMRRLETARRILGKGKLAADINAAWTPMQVLAARKDFARVGLDWLEEPVRFEDREGRRTLVREMPGISLMGFETEQGLSNLTHLVEDQMVDIVQPDIGWGGGVSELVKIGAMALANHKPVSLHSFGSAIYFVASLQVAAALPNMECIESEENENMLKSGILTTPFEADEHMNFYVPRLHGLGIELDWDALEQYVILQVPYKLLVTIQERGTRSLHL